MKINKLIKEIKNVFVLPEKKYYLGNLRYGIPFYYPHYFHPTIINIRRINKRKIECLDVLSEKLVIFKTYQDLPKSNHYNFLINIFNYRFFVEYGLPFYIHNQELIWKEKYGTPRLEYVPSFHITFFRLQFVIFWGMGTNEDKYYEMILWYLFYSDKDIEKAKNTWPWIDYKTKKSSWVESYIKKS
jgi:hypothetical protein